VGSATPSKTEEAEGAKRASISHPLARAGTGCASAGGMRTRAKIEKGKVERLPSWLKAPLSKSGSPKRRRGFGDAVEDGGGGGSEASEHIPPAGKSRDGLRQRRWDENPSKN